MPTVLELLGVPPPRGDRRRQRHAADDRRAPRSSASKAYSEALYPLHHFGWSDLRAHARGALQADRRAAARAVRSAGRSRRASRPVRRSARRSATACSSGCASAESRFSQPRGSQNAGRRSRSRRARAARGARLRRHVRHDGGAGRSAHAGSPIRRTRSACSTRSRRARDISKDDAAFDEVIAMLEGSHPRGSEGHRRVVHARQHVREGRASAGGDSVFQAGARAEAGRRYGRRQPGERVSPDRPRRRGAGRLQAIPGARSEERAGAVLDSREILLDRGDLQRRRRRSCGRRSRSSRSWSPRATRSASSRSSAATSRRPNARSARRSPRRPTCGWRTSTWRWSPRSAGSRRTRSPSIARRSSCTRASYKAWFNLGKLYAQLGNRRGAGGCLPARDRREPELRRGLLLSREAVSRRRAGTSTKPSGWRAKASRSGRIPNTRRSATT